jgi:photosynthetic reaction center cytochrome c subunit
MNRILVALIPVLLLSGLGQTSPQQKTAEEVYKNIQVFKGVPASELEGNMAFITGSLGVRCNYCHVTPFDKDEKPTKLAARKMIQMVLDINKGSFNGAGAVSCYTCHRGQPLPVSVPPLGRNLWAEAPPRPAQPETLPSVDEILDRYIQALGGRQAIENVKTRVYIGSRVGADGVLVPEEVHTKAPNKLLVITSYPNLVFRTGFNGTDGWNKSNQDDRPVNAEMLAELRREAEFYKETKLKEIYPTMRVLPKTKVGETEAYVIEATPAGGGATQKLFFDVQNGLLIRKYSQTKLTLGQFPTQTDYEDYRVVDGVKLPFMIRWAMPGRTWGRKLTEIKQNVVVEDVEFNSTHWNK